MVEPYSCQRLGSLESRVRARGPVLADLAVETRLAGSPQYGGPHLQVRSAFPHRSLARRRVVLAVEIPIHPPHQLHRPALNTKLGRIRPERTGPAEMPATGAEAVG